MGKGLEVQLAEIRAAVIEKRKKRNEALLDIFDAIAAAKAKAPGDLDAVVKEALAAAIRLGIVRYIEPEREEPKQPEVVAGGWVRIERQAETRASSWLGRDTSNWLGRGYRSRLDPVEQRFLEVKEALHQPGPPPPEPTIELPGGYHITESQLKDYERLFASRVEVWRARLSADEGPRWEKTAARLEERRRQLGWSTTKVATQAGISPRTVQRALAGRPISRANLEAIEKALKLR
ncbi:MAG: helix-turn-helix transcriptional regulator [Bryobacteraceae bacterium]